MQKPKTIIKPCFMCRKLICQEGDGAAPAAFTRLQTSYFMGSEGSGLRVEGSGLRVQGLGLRV